MAKITGDPEGVARLKAIAAEHKEFLRFLISEAQTNSDHSAGFAGEDGTKYKLVLDPASGTMEVVRDES